VKTDDKPPPANSGTRAMEVAVIETRPVSGKLTISVRYSESPSCERVHEAKLELDVPERGVCCPIGSEECNSGGPVGGWATDLHSCAPFQQLTDTYYRRETDLRDCPVLVFDDSVCCNCDAGVVEVGDASR
jgi:hypothetical protein